MAVQPSSRRQRDRPAASDAEERTTLLGTPLTSERSLLARPPIHSEISMTSMRSSKTMSFTSSMFADLDEDESAPSGGDVQLEILTNPIFSCLMEVHDVRLDDADDQMVLIFPRYCRSHRTDGLLATTMIDWPWKYYQKMFRTEEMPPDVFDQWEKREKHFTQVLRAGPVQMSIFQHVVRQGLMNVLQKNHLKATTFSSIDGDEVFMKITMKLNGKTMRDAAKQFEYRMPVRKEEYKVLQTKAVGTHPNGVPMRNKNNQYALAYVDYDWRMRDALEPFRNLDTIRLLQQLLSTQVNLSEMQHHHIVKGAFPGARYSKVKELSKEWANLRHVIHLPSHRHLDKIRDYFGEEIAFYFMWMISYVRQLTILAFAGVVAHVARIQPMFPKLQDASEICFAMFTIIFTVFFNQMFKQTACRYRQRWGMQDYDQKAAIGSALPSFDPELVGTRKGDYYRLMPWILLSLYLTFFTALVFGLSGLCVWERNNNSSWFTDHQPILTPLLIKTMSWVWRRLSYRLVTWQNHRTTVRWNNSMVSMLSTVKLFCTLYPFIYAAFLQNYVEASCGDDASALVHKVYHITGWPKGIEYPQDISVLANSTDIIPSNELGFLKGYLVELFHVSPWMDPTIAAMVPKGKHCIFGCFPVACFTSPGMDPSSPPRCVSNCWDKMTSSLFPMYFTHLGCNIVFLMIPVLLTRWEVYREMQQVKKAGKKYTYLQYQAKCHLVADYKFQSWGGSYIEDFLDVAISFALLVCFGLCLPLMAFFGLLVHMVEIRLLAYRLTHVTCRPFPHGAEGIGNWQFVFESISFLAVSINVGVAVIHLEPLRSLKYWQQFLVFIFAEKVLLSARQIIAAITPDEPVDVTRIEDFNSVVVRQLSTTYKHKETCEYDNDELCEYEQHAPDKLKWNLKNNGGNETVEVGLSPRSSSDENSDEEDQTCIQRMFGDTDPAAFLL